MKRISFSLLVVLCLLATAQLTQAADLYWDANGAGAGTGGTGTWDAATALWRNGSTAGALQTWADGNYAILPSAAGTITVSGTRSPVALRFDVGGYTVDGGTLTLTAGGDYILWNNGSFDNTINSDIILSTAGNATYGNRIAVYGGTLTLNGAISESGGSRGIGFFTDNAGSTILGGATANTFTGVTRLDRGILRLAKSDGVTAIPGNINIVGGGNWTNLAVELGANNQIADTSVISFTGGNYGGFRTRGFSETIQGLSSATGGGVIENGGFGQAIAASGTLTVSTGGNSYSFNGFMRDVDAGGGAGKLLFVKDGSGTQTLSGGNIVYTGATTVSGGTLALVNTTSFASTITNNAALSAFVNGNGAYRLVTSQAGTGAWTIDGPGGGTVFQNRVLLNGTSTSSNTDGNVNVINSGKLWIDRDRNAIGDAATVNLASTASFFLYASAGADGFGNFRANETIGGLSGSGAVYSYWVSGAAPALTVGGGDVSASFTGSIQAATGTTDGMTLTKTGTGTQTFTGGNINYAGATTVSGGTLALVNTTGFTSTITNNALVNATASSNNSVRLVTSQTGTGAWTIDGPGGGTVFQNRVLLNGSSTSSNSDGNVNVINGGKLWVDRDRNAIGDAATVDLAPSASFFLYGATGSDGFGNFRANETIGGLSGSGAVYSHWVSGTAPALIVGGGDVSASFSGSIQPETGTTNGMTLTKIGLGTQTFTGANTYSGNTIINAGTLSLTGAGSLGATAIYVGLNNGDNGTLTINTTANLSSLTTLVAGQNTGSVGTVNLDGGTLSFSSFFDIGNAGTVLTSTFKQTGGSVTTTGFTYIGNSGQGSFDISGGSYTAKGGVGMNQAAGATGASSLAIRSDGAFNVTTSGNFTMNQIAGGTSSLTISDNGAFSQSSGNFVSNIGATGTASISISDSGSFTQTSGNLVLSQSGGASTFTQSGGTFSFTSGAANFVDIGNSGTASVSVSGGTFTVNTSKLFIGHGGAGTLTLSNTGTITAPLLDFGFNGSSTVSGVMNLDGGTLQVGGVRKQGTGGGFTATFHFNGGTLKATASNPTFMTGLTTADVRNNGAVINTNGNDITIGQALLHSTVGGDNAVDGGLAKNGGGTLQLTNTNTYTGPTNVNGGTLNLNGSIATSSLTSVKSGAWLTGTGATGALTIDDGGTHKPGNSPGVTTVNGNYTENGTLVIEINGTGNGAIGGTNGYSQVKVLSGGSVALGGTSSLSVIYTGAGFSPSFGQVYTIIDNDGDTYGDTTGTFGNYLSEGMTAITIGTTPLKLYYHDGGGTDQNNVVLVASNIAAPNGSTLYVNNQWTTNQVVNGDLETNTDQAFVDITAFASPSALVANQPSLTGYVVVNGGSYASAPLAGGGDVQLRLVNDTVNGEPNVVLGNLTGDNGDGIVLNYHNGSGGNLTVQQGNFAGTLSEVGVGTLTKTTTGTLTLGGSNSYTGDTFIQGGVLEITANNALGTNAAGTTVSSGATLQLTGVNYTTAEALTLNGQGAAANTGALYVNGTTNTFAGAITLASNATIGVWNSGTLTLTGGIDKNGHNVTFQGNGITNTANINTVGISGAADLIVDNMTVNLNAANSYVGPTVIQNGGVLNANVSSALPTGTYSPVTITGATSRLNVVADQTAASLTGNGIVDNAGAAGNRVLTLEASSGSTTFSGVIQNTGAGTLSLVKNGGSTQVLTGNNTYTGTTTVTGGSLHLAGGGLENSDISVTGGTLLQTAGTNHVTGSGPSSGNLTVNGGVYHLDGGTLDFQDYSAGGAATWTPAANEASTISLTTGADFEFTGGRLLDVSNITTAGSAGTFTQNGGSFIVGQDGVGPAALTTLNGGFSLVDGVVRFDAFGVDSTPEQCCDGIAGLNDQLTVTGDATLDSVVNIDFVGFTPVFGDVFTLICANDITIGDNFSLTGGYFRVVPTGLGPEQPQYALQAIVPEPASVALWGLVSLAGMAIALRTRYRSSRAALAPRC